MSKNIIKVQNVDKGGRGEGGQSMWTVIEFYNIIIKSANVDGGEGGLNAYPQNVDKRHVFFNPSIRYTLGWHLVETKMSMLGAVLNTCIE